MGHIQAISIMATLLILMVGCNGIHVLICATFDRARAVK